MKVCFMKYAKSLQAWLFFSVIATQNIGAQMRNKSHNFFSFWPVITTQRPFESVWDRLRHEYKIIHSEIEFNFLNRTNRFREYSLQLRVSLKKITPQQVILSFALFLGNTNILCTNCKLCIDYLYLKFSQDINWMLNMTRIVIDKYILLSSAKINCENFTPSFKWRRYQNWCVKNDTRLKYGLPDLRVQILLLILL